MTMKRPWASGSFDCAAHLGGTPSGAPCARRTPHETGHIFDHSGGSFVADRHVEAIQD